MDPCACCPLSNDLFLPSSLRENCSTSANKENTGDPISSTSTKVTKNKKKPAKTPLQPQRRSQRQPSRGSRKRGGGPPPPASAASPNKRTRSQRQEDNAPVEDTVFELRRIHKIIEDFKNEDWVPCSVFGSNRLKEWEDEDFFFCGQCDNADWDEKSGEKLKVNRKRKKGPYTCIAKHRNLVKPTARRYPDGPPPRINKKKRRQDRRQRRRNDPQPIPTSRFQPPVMGPSATLSDIEEEDDEDDVENNRTISSVEQTEPQEQLVDDGTGPPEQEEASTPIESQGNQLNDSESSESEAPVEQDNTVTMAVDSSVDMPVPIQPLNPSINLSELSLQEEVRLLKERLRKSEEQVETQTKKLRNESDKLRDAKKKIEELERNCATCQSRRLPTCVTSNDQADTLVQHIRSVIEDATKNIRSSNSRALKYFYGQVAELCLDESVHEGQLKQCSYSVFRDYVRQNIYTPHRVLKQMDLRGGVLNYEGIELLRSVETDGVPREKTLLPSSGCMKAYAALVESFGRNICPFIMKTSSKNGTEGFAFRAADVLLCLLKAGHLLNSEAVVRSIRIAASLDGAQFTKNLSHTLVGIKFNDPSNPYAQSQQSVFPVGCVAMPETTENVVGVFARTLEEIKEAVGVVSKAHKIKKPTLCFNCDMKCDWELSGRGGAAKQHTYPCSKCAIHSGQLCQPSGIKPDKCKTCTQLDHHHDPTWICRHVKMLTEEHTATLKKEVDDFRNGPLPLIAKDLALLEEHSELSMQDDPNIVATEMQANDILSIQFDLNRATQEQRQEYSRLVTSDLRLRRLQMTGSLEERQERLKNQRVKEWSYKRALECLDNAKASQKRIAIVLMMDAIPCLLHLENRMGIKFLTMVLKTGMNNAINPKDGVELEWMPPTTTTKEDRCVAFVSKVNGIMNSTILGSEDQPTQWTVPYDTKTCKIGDITMDNVRIRKLLIKFELLIDCCFVDNEKAALFKSAIYYFREGLKKVNVRHEMSDSEIFAFQKDIDYFYRDWCSLYGVEGITNYAHMLGSGHCMEYLLHWRNLWLHSQQGWEGKFNPQLCI